MSKYAAVLIPNGLGGTFPFRANSKKERKLNKACFMLTRTFLIQITHGNNNKIDEMWTHSPREHLYERVPANM